MLSPVELGVELKTPVAAVEGVHAVGDPVAQLVKDHLRGAIVGVQRVARTKLQEAGAVGGREDRGVAAHA